MSKKRKIVVPQHFEETESEKLDEENGEEEQTKKESEVDEVIPRKKNKIKTPVKKKIAEKSNKRTIIKQGGVIDYINK